MEVAGRLRFVNLGVCENGPVSTSYARRAVASEGWVHPCTASVCLCGIGKVKADMKVLELDGVDYRGRIIHR